MKTTKCCVNGSEIDVKNDAEVEAGMMQRLLLKRKRDWWRECCWNWSGSDEKCF